MNLFENNNQKLRLEIETRNRLWTSFEYENTSEAHVSENEVFYDVGWHDAILFRLRDTSEPHKPTRGMLALTPSQIEFGRIKVYQMYPAYNWLVMMIDWVEK